MLDLKDINYMPDIFEISNYIGNPLFDSFCEFMDREYKALRGWNIKLRKAGKSLCVIYPKENYFTVLVVIGNKEKEKVEGILPQLSDEMQTIYRETKEGNGQRWLMIELHSNDCIYQDTLKLIRIRRESK